MARDELLDASAVDEDFASDGIEGAGMVGDHTGLAQEIVPSVVKASYRFEEYKSKKKPARVLTQVMLHGTGALQLEVVFLLKHVDDGLGILAGCQQIVNAHCDMFVVVATITHPQVILRLGQRKSHR